jgi:hypothetical protein
MAEDNPLIAREARLRRLARRRGLELSRVRRRDRRALDYGKYNLVDQVGKVVLALASIDQIEAILLAWNNVAIDEVA